MVRALDCEAKHQWFKMNPWIIVGMFAHCPPNSKWVPGGNTWEVKGSEERNWPPYPTMLVVQDKCPYNGHSPMYGTVHGTHLYFIQFLIFIVSVGSVTSFVAPVVQE